jgi:hypothetical protein
MIITDLYNHALLDPCKTGSHELYIISGYASATFAYRHLEDTSPYNTKINLIIGMPGRRADYNAYIDLCSKYKNRFFPYYYEGKPPVHMKTYGWFSQDNLPVKGFSGSANYSQPGFFDNRQKNQLTEESPTEIKTQYDLLLCQSKYIPETNAVDYPDLETHELPITEGSILPGKYLWEIEGKRARISFLANNGTLPARSGLNWGQRPEIGREPNQAYLSLRGDTRKDGFLPERAYTFSLITDDDQSFDCAVAQDGRKAIHTTANNSLLGIYFRNRLGVSPGELVTIDHLNNYGRTDFAIEKIDDETFLLDFSKK